MCRFYLWFTWGWGTWRNWKKNYATHHRKHHANSDTKDDPHSPQYFTWWQMCQVQNSWKPGHSGYVSKEDEEKYASDIDSGEDWIWKNLYSKYPRLGPTLMWIIATLLFGVSGFICGAMAFFLMNIFGMTLVNWALHKIGWTYEKNKDPNDKSTILCPWGILLGGEELHTHHHNNPGNPKFSKYWWEIDSSWGYMLLLEKIGAIKIHRVKS